MVVVGGGLSCVVYTLNILTRATCFYVLHLNILRPVCGEETRVGEARCVYVLRRGG